MTDEELVRRIEEEVLDLRYREFAITRRRSILAVGHVLKIFGDSIRDLHRGVGVTAFHQARYRINATIYGLGHCLQWLLTNPVAFVRLPNERWEVLDREAAQFLRWGVQYAMLANDHTAWSHKLVSASVDRLNKRIIFNSPAGANPSSFV